MHRGAATQVGSTPQVGYASPCPYCEGYQAEIAMLKRRLADIVTINPTGVTEKLRGRPNSGNALTPAEKQRAYRERQSDAHSG